MTAFFNLHTHTVYDDGKDIPEDIVKEAIDKNMSCIGFSVHSFTPFETEYCADIKTQQEYFRDVSALKKKYAGKIRVLCGIEQDFFSDAPSLEYDFIIGSAHYIKKDGDYITVDLSADLLAQAADRYYMGDIYSLIEDYYITEGSTAEKTRCDIIGHFDLITKFNEKRRLFDETDQRYIAAAKKAADKLLLSGAVFEINTGAIARGFRTSPYPSSFMTDYIAKKGGSFILSSDCHEKEHIDCRFAELYKKYGGLIKDISGIAAL